MSKNSLKNYVKNYEERDTCRDHIRWSRMLNLNFTKADTVLELGASNLEFLHWIKSNFASRCIGIDLAFSPQVKQRADEKDILYFEGDLNSSDCFEEIYHVFLNKQKADYIFCFDIIEHLEAPFMFLKCIKSILKPGGHLIITSPNINSIERFLHPKQWSGVLDQHHNYLFSTYSLKIMAERAGFQTITASAPMRKLEPLLPFKFNLLGGQSVLLSKS